MKSLGLILVLLFLTSCGNETFSPNYNEYVCMPPGAGSSSAEFLTVSENPATDTDCCLSSGIAACCFGGGYVCVNGDTGIGCGCPIN